MTLDLVVAGLLLLGALLGAIKGAARQLAQLLAAVLAWLAAGPVGHFFGDVVAGRLGTSLTVGVVIATFTAFLLIFIVVQLVATGVLRRLLSGREPGNRGLDRLLGLVLGAAKFGLIAYVALCAATFVESNVVLAGRRLVLTPRDSLLAGLCRQYNLLEVQQFSGVKDLVAVARLASEPGSAAKLKANPDYVALSRNPRFKKALDAAGMRKAIESGDYRALLESNPVVELIQDPAARHHLERIADQR